MPKLLGSMDRIKFEAPDLARRAAPLIDQLKTWDGRISPQSAAATLASAWYERLYGSEYPGETLLAEYVDRPIAQLEALVAAADTLEQKFGKRQVPWAESHAVQRHAQMIDPVPLPFDDSALSLPCIGGHGPMGVIYTQYYSPVLRIPFIETQKKHYAMVGPSYLAAYEFGDRFRGSTLVNFGESADPASPHFFDQAKLMATGKFKQELFHWDDVLAGTKRSYHPGQ
jgi:acyl-homoserine lactone acylase PvdQ